MLWYSGDTARIKSMIKYKKKNSLKKLKKNKFTMLPKISITHKYYPIHIPKNWNLILIKNSYQIPASYNSQIVVYMYSPLYFFQFSIDYTHSYVVYDYVSQSITTNTLYSPLYMQRFWRSLIDLSQTIHKPFYVKLKFKGKGYYLYKNKRGTITPQFGYSHRLYTYSFFVRVKFLSKTSIILFGFIKEDLKTVGFKIKNMRPINIFTGRGVRFNKQIIYKKVGKVSSYR